MIAISDAGNRPDSGVFSLATHIAVPKPDFTRCSMPFRCALLVVLFVLFSFYGLADQPSEPKKEAAADESAVRKENRLRKPGFLFLELTVSDFAANIKFFEDVAGYKVVRKEENFAILQTEFGELLLNGTNRVREKPAARIAGLEIGLVVGDLDQTFAAAKEFDWRITSGIAKQPWGVRDFRVLSPDGYYLRFTE
jgi:lactoylglutathione lyase